MTGRSNLGEMGDEGPTDEVDSAFSARGRRSIRPSAADGVMSQRAVPM